MWRSANNFLLFPLMAMIASVLFCPPAKSFVTRAQALKTGAPYMVYIPDKLDRSRKHPCLFAISPNGRGERALTFMKSACDRYQWILIAPENRGTAVQFLALDKTMRDVLQSALANYPINPQRVVSAGFAGGGMEAHHISSVCPDLIRGVIANCGIIHADGMRDPDYAEGKLAVLITNPGDFRYMQMKQNADFLVEHQWQVAWLEFQGGHRWAPPALFEKAVGLLEQKMCMTEQGTLSDNAQRF